MTPLERIALVRAQEQSDAAFRVTGNYAMRTCVVCGAQFRNRSLTALCLGCRQPPTAREKKLTVEALGEWLRRREDVGAADVASAFGVAMDAARAALSRAVKRGCAVRVGVGLYSGVRP